MSGITIPVAGFRGIRAERPDINASGAPLAGVLS